MPKTKKKQKPYIIDYGTYGTVDTIWASNIQEAKRKAQAKVHVRARTW